MDTKKTLIIVILLNLGYFFVEFFGALAIDSVSLLADSIDFLEDVSVNFLIFLALGFSLTWRRRVGYFLIILLLLPSFLALLKAIDKFLNPTIPEPFTLSFIALGALIVNLFCAYLMLEHKKSDNSLLLAAFYSARNDAIANVAMIVAGFLTYYLYSHYPDLIVGIGVLILNIRASQEVYETIKKESQKLKDA